MQFFSAKRGIVLLYSDPIVTLSGHIFFKAILSKRVDSLQGKRAVFSAQLNIALTDVLNLV